MSKIRIYMEGGSAGAARVELRKGMTAFLQKCLGAHADLTVIRCGARAETYKAFRRGLNEETNSLSVLLVDSEAPVSEPGKCWKHLSANSADKWKRPDGTEESQCQLMVQAMEAWLLSDPEALGEFYGSGFKSNVLPKSISLEELPRERQMEILDRAVSGTGKRKYDKVKHAPLILALLNPETVRARAWHCNRLLETLEEIIRRS